MNEYKRKLTASEVNYGFIAISDQEFRKQIPRGEKIKVRINGDEYSGSLDKYRRLGFRLRRIFLEHNVQPADTISVRRISSRIFKIEKTK